MNRIPSLVWLVALMLPLILWGQSTNEPAPAMTPDDDFGPGFVLFGLFVFILVLIVIGAGAVMALLVCLIVAGLVATGVLSSSVVIGLVKRSPQSALRALVLQAGIGGGLLAGLVIAAVLAEWNGMPWHDWTSMLTGALLGGGSGLAVAWLCNAAWGAVVNWLLARVGKRPETKESHVA